jgi:hypothetical protein
MFSTLPHILNRIITVSKEYGSKTNVVLGKDYVGVLGQL